VASTPIGSTHKPRNRSEKAGRDNRGSAAYQSNARMIRPAAPAMNNLIKTTLSNTIINNPQ
jgi:hypothetical protein